jgi:dUTP pyrophosphatase
MKMSTEKQLDRSKNRIRFALISTTAKEPTRKNPTDAGIDLYLDSPNGDIEMMPGDVKIMHTGLKVAIWDGCIGWIANKSRADYLIGGGIVDQDYQGELLVKVINVTNDVLVFKHHDAIAQLLLVWCKLPKISVTDFASLYENESDRGEDGGIARQDKDNDLQVIFTDSADDDYPYEMDDFLYDSSREYEMFD